MAGQRGAGPLASQWAGYVRELLLQPDAELGRYWQARHRQPATRPSVQGMYGMGDATRTPDPDAVRDYNTPLLLREWNAAQQKREQVAWSAEVNRLPLLRTYARIKLRLQREEYLNDTHRSVGTSYSSRRAIMDMARLRCGVNDLAISRGRRGVNIKPALSGTAQPAGDAADPRGPLPAAQRICAWCDNRRLQADMQLVREQHACPVEDEEHVVLWCGLHRGLRASMVADVERLTGLRGQDGRLVRPTGPVKLGESDMLRAVSDTRVSDDRVDAALAIVLGGLLSKRPMGNWSAAERTMDVQVQQVCKQYVGQLLQRRREWQQQQQRQERDSRHGHADGGNALTLWLRPQSTTSSADDSCRRRDGGQHGGVDRNNSGNYGNHLRRRTSRGQCVRDTLSVHRGRGRGRGGAISGSRANTQSAGGADRAARTGEEHRVVRRVQLRAGSAGRKSVRGRESFCSTQPIMRFLSLPTPQSTQATQLTSPATGRDLRAGSRYGAELVVRVAC